MTCILGAVVAGSYQSVDGSRARVIIDPLSFVCCVYTEFGLALVQRSQRHFPHGIFISLSIGNALILTLRLIKILVFYLPECLTQY